MKPKTAAQSTGLMRFVGNLNKLRLGGHKKAGRLCDRASFRDPVGIRTPNLLIRSEVLYPVELQSRSTLTLR